MSQDKFYGWVGHDNSAANGNMVWGEFQPKVFKETDVEIDVTHCGICATDIHTLKSGWGDTPYPCVVGHEIVGKITRLGSSVNDLKIGQRVGIGAQCDSCGRCHICNNHQESYCKELVTTYASYFKDGSGKSYGGYAENWRGPARFVIPIPDGLESHVAAPLLCGGITIYSPLRNNGCGQPGVKKVGIVGIGGIGAFGLAFAKALEAEQVVAISSTSSKKDLAHELGATDFVAMKDEPEAYTQYIQKLDLIVVTANNGDQPFDKYLSMLRPQGKVVNIARPDNDEPVMPIPIPTLLFTGTFIGGSLVGSPDDIAEMLKVAADKKPKFLIEKRDFRDANQAVVDMENGKARFRYTLVRN